MTMNVDVNLSSQRDMSAIGTHGTVDYNRVKFPTCCGVTNLSNLYFKIKEGHTKQQLYDEFFKFLQTNQQDPQLNRCKILMTDRVREDQRTSVFDFGMSQDGWYCSAKAIPNPNSGNKVVVFEMDRKVFGVNSFGNSGYLKQDGTRRGFI